MKNREIEDLAWRCLPREFREEVKKMRYSAHYTNEQKFMIRLLFGDDNLTSDAEGEEMLTVSRNAANERIKADFHGKETAHYSDHINHVLRQLFGSKCLPDDTCNVASNVASLEEKSTKPKFKVGDQVLYKDSEVVRVITGTVGSDNYYIQGQCKCIPASDLKPYTGSADLNTDCPTCTDVCSSQDFDNIIKNGFREHNRLHIAAMAMQGMLSNTTRFSSYEISDLVRISLNCADALIAECMTTDK